jgi:hypothetical protein
MRTDYNDGTVGFWWKACNLQEWFVFNPAMADAPAGGGDGKTKYKKDANGSIIIDVNLLGTPYMTYRK